MSDTELTGQDWRILTWVSLHDGMSFYFDEKKGKRKGGLGCTASNKLLFEKAGCDYTSGCRSLSKLVDRGHLVRERLGKATVYRVVFPDPDNLQACNISAVSIGSKAASHSGGIACKPNSQITEKSAKPQDHYITPSGELNSVETGIKNSSEDAHFYGGDRQVRVDDKPAMVISRPTRGQARKGAEAPAIQEWVLTPHLPGNFTKLPPGAMVSRFEAAFNAIGRDPSRMASRERVHFAQWLNNVAELHNGENDDVAGQARRLWEEVAMF